MVVKIKEFHFYEFCLGILLVGVGLGFTGIGISLMRSKSYSLEHEQFRLIVGAHLLQQASDTLQQSAETSAIAPGEKQQIKNLTDQTAAVLEPVLEQIDIDLDIPSEEP